MDNATLALALLLGAGFLAAKLGQRARLPSVTGYILAGLALGPSGLNLVTAEVIDHRLSHFTHIALMLITFGIGEHLEIRRLRHKAKSLGVIGSAEVAGAFLLVSLGIFAAARLTLSPQDWQWADFGVLAILLGAVSVATAPASTLHVVHEIKAAGPFTSMLLALVAVNNGLAIMLFGFAVSTAHHLTGAGKGSVLQAILASVTEIVSAVALGVLAGLLIDFAVHRLRRRSEMLTIGLALLLFAGEAARLLHLSSLLTGMAAGFTLVNRDVRDVRLFRQLNAFEPPVYVLFFTLAGAHLDVRALWLAGWLGLVYFLCRAGGKLLGAWLGAVLARASCSVRHNMGLALMPQAGIAIGLVILIREEPGLSRHADLITPVVLAGVVLSELAGPVCARWAMERAGEAGQKEPNAKRPGRLEEGMVLARLAVPDNFQLVPWTWERLQPAPHPEGVVIFGAAHVSTVTGLARFATLLAHSRGGLPLAVRVVPSARATPAPLREEPPGLFSAERQEAASLGYPLQTAVVEAQEVAAGLLAMANQVKTWAIVLGHPRKGTAQEFRCVVDTVAAQAPCQVIVARFAGLLHTERILVPVAGMRELGTVRNVVLALAAVGEHRIKLLRLLPSEATEQERQGKRQQLLDWAVREGLANIYVRVVATEARLETIVQMAERYDLLVMAAGQGGLQKLFFGSLAESVAQHCAKPLLMVHPGPEQAPFPGPRPGGGRR